MPIICLEGASAVGKTTTAGILEATAGAFVVPEVNELFARPANAPAAWYFERQIDRFARARRHNETRPLVILDGDALQPLWYNWAYDYAGWQNLDFIERFYRPRILDRTLDFPDLYFILTTAESELRKRRAGDSRRTRRNFETHLKMIEPQRRYFEALREASPRRVFFLEAKTPQESAEFIRKHAADLTARTAAESAAESAALFDQMIYWLRAHKA